MEKMFYVIEEKVLK